ncbi:radical SAM protein [Streptomyces specialis]|uniref:radical SAM protein n=1 Tax=Streptomyces specialis TaxID=498367 RepID=UPI003899C66C
MFSGIPEEAAQAREELSSWRKAIPAQQLPDPDDNCDCSPDGQTSAARPLTAYSLWLELVEDCNLDCLFCYNSWRPKGRGASVPLLAEHYMDLVDSIMSAVHIRHVTLSGGEPLMFPLLRELFALIHRNACRSVGITTNGRSMTRKKMRSLVSSGVTQISVPVHSHHPSVHDQLAKGRSWKSAVRALALGTEHGIATTLSCVVTSLNEAHVRHVVDIAKVLGLRSVVLNCMHPTGSGASRSDLEISPQTFAERVSDAWRSLSCSGRVTVGSPPASRPVSNRSIDRIVLSPFGDIKLCNQSHAGILNAVDNPGEFAAFLSATREELAARYGDRVDNCSCRSSM